MGSLKVIGPMAFYPGCPATFGGYPMNKLLLLKLSISLVRKLAAAHFRKTAAKNT